MINRTYALVGRYGDDGGRYLTSQWPQMKARSWLGNRWLLAEPVRKPVKTARIHVDTRNRWAELNQQIARILGGSEHV